MLKRWVSLQTEKSLAYLEGHSRTYQPKLHHYVTNIGDFWFKGDIYDENLKNLALGPLGADLKAFEI